MLIAKVYLALDGEVKVGRNLSGRRWLLWALFS
jgi:hypothetical protein